MDDVAHFEFMRRAFELGAMGQGNTFPSPSVGCVIVKDGAIIGEGFTQAGGRPHAEFVALSMAGELAKGADIYVTLEPCAHESERGPNCTSLLIAAKPKQVFIAMIDPDPRTAGKGILALRENNIATIAGIMADEAKIAHAEFIEYINSLFP